MFQTFKFNLNICNHPAECDLILLFDLFLTCSHGKFGTKNNVVTWVVKVTRNVLGGVLYQPGKELPVHVRDKKLCIFIIKVTKHGIYQETNQVVHKIIAQFSTFWSPRQLSECTVKP